MWIIKIQSLETFISYVQSKYTHTLPTIKSNTHAHTHLTVNKVTTHLCELFCDFTLYKMLLEIHGVLLSHLQQTNYLHIFCICRWNQVPQFRFVWVVWKIGCYLYRIQICLVSGFINLWDWDYYSKWQGSPNEMTMAIWWSKDLFFV